MKSTQLKLLFLIIFVLNQSAFSYLTKDNFTNWIFGQYAGLEFNLSNRSTTKFTTDLNTWEGTSVVSNNSGEILFYTNGVNLYNGENQVITGNLNGHESATQSTIIAQKPNSNDLYYIFTIGAAENVANSSGIYYTIVEAKSPRDVKIIQYPSKIQQDNIESLTAFYNKDNDNIWIVSYNYKDGYFYSFLLTQESISLKSRSRSINGPTSITGACIRASSNGELIAFAHHLSNAYEVYKFNFETGELISLFNLKSSNFIWPYGVEFSSNNQYLYASDYKSNKIYKFDLNLPSAQSIISNALHIVDSQVFGTLQMGPDDKIYIACDGSTNLSVIEKPDNPGTLCNYQGNYINLSPSRSRLGLPQLVIRRCNDFNFKFDLNIISPIKTNLCSDSKKNASLQFTNTTQNDFVISEINSLNSYFKKTYKDLYLSMKPNETKTIEIELNDKITNNPICFDTICFVTSYPCVKKIYLPVEYNSNHKVKIWAKDTSANFQLNLCIPIYAKIIDGGKYTCSFDYKIDIKIDKNVFKSLKLKFGKIKIIDSVDNYYNISIQDNLNEIDTNERIINYLCGDFVFGSLTYSVIELNNTGQYKGIEVLTGNGSIRGNLCAENIRGIKLFNPTEIKINKITDSELNYTLTTDESSNFLINIYNLLGEIVYSNSINTTNKDNNRISRTIPVDLLTNGFYVLNFQSPNSFNSKIFFYNK